MEASTNYEDPEVVLKVSRGLGMAMAGSSVEELEKRLAKRGW